ncbi:adhesion G protein-coupled receptor F5 [Halichoeres trimaculatus]|uniref:adhesion G protein-coupled receptor F5 n=1 Tax=Halichoeres trimaculatus TaxID=147232 RepID=UPI003D9F7A6E
MTTLENKFKAVLLVDTYGMVNIEAPADPVCYHSSPELKCTLEDMSDSSGWNMSRMHASFELAEGSVVKIDKHCAMQKLHSCIAVKLEKVTGMWTGLYECGFTIGSVRHTAKSKLQVALLPDEIILESKPLVADCTKTNQAKVDITATILNSPEPFNVTCSLPGCKQQKKFEVPKNDQIYTSYTFMAPISCKSQKEGHSVNITFTNARGQSKSAKITIPVIYGSEKVCKKETLHEDTWPDTPGDDTVIIRTCPEGRTGYKSRTCIGSTWQPVFYHCVSQELNNNQMAADNFLKGLGATEEVALNIFERLKNSSIAFKSDSSSNTADIDRSISILDSMAKASETIVLQDSVLKDFVESASNMLDNSWTGINESVSYKMSANYLESVESLVKNIEVNQSNGIDSQNLELNFCRSSDCMVSVFDINVSLNKSSGILKTLGVKNLMEKLKNSYGETERTSLLLSATLSGNNDSSVEIQLDFPREDSNYTKPVCVFWNTTFNDWSDKGCSLKTSSDNRSVCVCNHLTAFSVLMSKGDVSDEFLSIITYVGLGVSICSLLIFLLVESLVWSAVVKTGLSLFRHTALVNIAVFLLLGDCCFLATTSPKEISDTMCLALTVCKHLFFLAMFSWMLCMSVMLVHQLIFVFSPLRKRVFMFLSSIVGYVCPVLIVGSSYIYCKYTESDYVDRDKCWLKYERILVGSIHAFLLPVGTVIFTNLFSMVVVIITLLKSNVPDGSKADEKETAKGIIKVVVFLTPVFGLTWIIGFAMLILGENSPLFQVFNYSFTILNSFQGFFLLLTGCFAEPKVRDELCRLLKIKGKGRTESTKNLTSTTYTKDK